MSWARAILWIVLLAALAGTIYFGLGWYRYDRKLEKWRTEVLVEKPVDLSKLETFAGPATLSTGVPCKVEFVLWLDTEKAIDISVLKPLVGVLSITEFDNDAPISGFPVQGDLVEVIKEQPQAFVIARMHPWGTRPCTFELQVITPVTKLVGIKQRLLIKYQLCGLESMVLVVYGVFTSLCFIAGLIAACVLYQMRKSRLTVEVVKTSDELR